MHLLRRFAQHDRLRIEPATLVEKATELATVVAILLDGVAGMPGCHSYIIAEDPSDENALWITEVWDSQVSYEVSLTLLSVQQVIAKGRPLIAGFGERFITSSRIRLQLTIY